MTRSSEAATLLEQARVLRSLAPSFDHPIVKYDFLKLAEWCEELSQTADEVAPDLQPAITDRIGAGRSDQAPQGGTIEEVLGPTHKSLRELYAYWSSKQGSQIGPSRSALCLEDVDRLLPNIAFADVVGNPPRFRFRTFGKNLARAYGEDVVGKFLDEIDMGSASLTSEAIKFWTRIVQERRPQSARIRYTKQQDYRYVDYERIGLPLSEDGKEVTTILLAYAFDIEFMNAAAR